jgi:two-component system CheB/CheR fusion protein
MNEHSPAAATVRLRPTDGPLIGTTAFFRNRAFLGAFCRQIRPAEDGPTQIMAHACSIGAEAYSLAIRMMIERPELDFQIDATDLSQGFVNYAARGVYPAAVMQGAVAEEQRFFQQIDDETVAIASEVRARVNCLPARSFAEFEAEKVYDAVILCNALVYVDGPTQGATIDRIAGYNTNIQ